MVRAAGQKQAQPENDPHHTTLHFVHNKNQQKKSSENIKFKAIKSTLDLESKKEKISGGLSFSASRAPKRLTCNDPIPLPFREETYSMTEKKETKINMDENYDYVDIEYTWMTRGCSEMEAAEMAHLIWLKAIHNS